MDLCMTCVFITSYLVLHQEVNTQHTQKQVQTLDSFKLTLAIKKLHPYCGWSPGLCDSNACIAVDGGWRGAGLPSMCQVKRKGQLKVRAKLMSAMQ